MYRSNLLKVFLWTCLMGLFTLSARAQSRHLSAKNMALGGGGTAYMDSYHANFINPANLMLNADKRPTFTIGLLGGISSNVGGSLANVTVYNKYFTHGYTIDAPRTHDVLNDWFGSENNKWNDMGMNADLVGLGLVYRNPKWVLSAAMRLRVLQNTRMSKGFAAFAFQGVSQEFFNTPRPVDVTAEVLEVGEISVGFATQVWHSSGSRLYVGVAPKLLLGLQGSRFDMKSTLQVKNNVLDHSFSYSMQTVGSLTDSFRQYYQDHNVNGQDVNIDDYVDLQSSDASSVHAVGVGLDLGATFEKDVSGMLPGTKPGLLRLAVSITDLGSLNFNQKSGVFSNAGDFHWDGFTYNREQVDKNYDSIGDYMEHVVVDSVGKDIYLDYAPNGSQSFGRSLPTMINAGAQLVWGKWSGMLDYGVGLVSRGMNSKRSSLALGAEYRLLNFIPLRVGMRTGGMTSTAYSVGTGVEFRHFEFTVGAMTTVSSAGNGYLLGAAWSGIVVHI